MALITESIVVRLRDPKTGETRTQKIPVGEPWPFLDCEEEEEAKTAKGGKSKGKAEAKPDKAEAKSGKPKGKAGPKRTKAPRRDLRDPEVLEALAAEVMKAIEGGASRPAEIAKALGADPVQVSIVLKELAEAGSLIREGRGRGTRYLIPRADAPTPAAEPAPVPEVVPATTPRVRLRWNEETIRGRETLAASFEDGAFRIVPLRSGAHALFFERPGGEVMEYGCGAPKVLRERAKEIAAAGLPSPEMFRAAGGDISQCQPRRLRLDDVELTWRETVEDGRQICVAATGDGEFKMLQSHGGSFILVFVREGDTEIDRLGCGSREELEGRALDILGQAEGDAVAADDQAPAPEPTAPADSGADQGDLAPEVEGAMMGDVSKVLLDQIAEEDDDV